MDMHFLEEEIRQEEAERREQEVERRELEAERRQQEADRREEQQRSRSLRVRCMCPHIGHSFNFITRVSYFIF